MKIKRMESKIMKKGILMEIIGIKRIVQKNTSAKIKDEKRCVNDFKNMIIE